MANPTRGWDAGPIIAWYFQNPGQPETGTIELVRQHRIKRVDGRAIYANGTMRKVRIGVPEDQDPQVRDLIHDRMLARDRAAQGEAFNEEAWELRWQNHLKAAIFTKDYFSDDPDVTPHGTGDDGYRIMVKEILDHGGGREYPIQLLMADMEKPVPGFNLADAEIPPGSPSVPAPIYSKGQPGGIPALSPEGKVLDAFGNVVGDVDPAQVRQAVAEYGAVRKINGVEPDEDGNVVVEGTGGGPVDYDDVPAGSTFTVAWNGTAWPTTRPSARADLTFIFRGGPTAPTPPTVLPGSDFWAPGAVL